MCCSLNFYAPRRLILLLNSIQQREVYHVFIMAKDPALMNLRLKQGCSPSSLLETIGGSKWGFEPTGDTARCHPPLLKITGDVLIRYENFLL